MAEGEQNVGGGHVVPVGELNALTKLDGQRVLCVLHLGGQLRRHVPVGIAGPQALAHGMNQEAAGVGLKIGGRVKGGGICVGAVAEHLQPFGGLFLCRGCRFRGSSRRIAALGGGFGLVSAGGKAQTENKAQKQCKQTGHFLHIRCPSFHLAPFDPSGDRRTFINYKTGCFYCKTTKTVAPNNNLYCHMTIHAVKSGCLEG